MSERYVYCTFIPSGRSPAPRVIAVGIEEPTGERRGGAYAVPRAPDGTSVGGVMVEAGGLGVMGSPKGIVLSATIREFGGAYAGSVLVDLSASNAKIIAWEIMRLAAPEDCAVALEAIGRAAVERTRDAEIAARVHDMEVEDRIGGTGVSDAEGVA